MSPEVTSNNGPLSIKRRKSREKPPQSLTTNSSEDRLNSINTNNYLPSTHPPPVHLNFSSEFYPFNFNYSGATTQPLSLPPMYPMNYTAYPYNTHNCSTNSSTSVNNDFDLYSSKSHYHRHHGHFNGSTTNDEYMSLPPTLNQKPQQHQHFFDINNDAVNEHSIDKRRFSDPCLPNDNDSSTGDGSLENNRIVQQLVHQVNSLRETNRTLSRDVMELRMEISILKQSYRNSDKSYEPGMLADIVREVRDAAKVREDALLAKVKHMLEENQMSTNQYSLITEKQRNIDRITKLEEQLKSLSIESSIRSNDNANEHSVTSARQVLELEREALELRRELQDTRAKKEEADQKILLLDKRLSTLLQRNDTVSTSNAPDDDKRLSSIIIVDGNSSSSLLSTNTSSSQQQHPQQQPAPQASTPRITLSGPVTDL